MKVHSVFVISILPLLVICYPNRVIAQTSGVSGLNTHLSLEPSARVGQIADRSSLTPKRSTVRSISEISASIANTEAAGPRDVGSNTRTASVDRYTVGIRDVIEIKLNGADGNAKQFVVSEDGTIDMILAGGPLFVVGKTPREIEAALRKKIALYSDEMPGVSVKDRASHAIEVSGAVATPGIMQLQRDLVPLYVIAAAAIPSNGVKTASVIRTELGIERVYKVDLQERPDLLILPGDRIEFKDPNNDSVSGYFYVTGKAAKVGKFDLTAGLTVKNVVAFAALSKDAAKRVRVRTRNIDGTLSDIEIEVSLLAKDLTNDKEITHGSIIEFMD